MSIQQNTMKVPTHSALSKMHATEKKSGKMNSKNKKKNRLSESAPELLKKSGLMQLGFYPQLLIAIAILGVFLAGILYSILLPYENTLQIEEFSIEQERQLNSISKNLTENFSLASPRAITLRLEAWLSSQTHIVHVAVYGEGKGLVFDWNAQKPIQSELRNLSMPILLNGLSVGEIQMDWDTYPAEQKAAFTLRRMITMGIGLAVVLMAFLMIIFHLLVMRHLMLLRLITENQDNDRNNVSDSVLIAKETAQLADVIAHAQDTWSKGQLMQQTSDRLQGYLRAIISNAYDGIVVLDSASKIKSINPMAEKMLKTTQARAMGKGLEQMIKIIERSPSSGTAQNDNEKPQHDQVGLLPDHEMTSLNETIKVMCPNKSTRYYDLSQATFESEGDRFGVIILRDTTAHKEQTEYLERARNESEVAAKAKTQFLAMMSHEIRTPLNGIIGVLQLMQDAKTQADIQNYIQQGLQSSESLMSIIGNLLDISSIEVGKTVLENSHFAPKQISEEEISLAQNTLQGKPIQIKIDIAEDLPPLVDGDSGKIRQIIRNMLSNAIKFTDKGLILLTVRAIPNKDTSSKVKLFFSVQDTGIGIAEGNESSVFGEFDSVNMAYTRQYGGAGLGMAISKGLVELMGGKIGFSSEPQKGSNFWFYVNLPIVLESHRIKPSYKVNRSEKDRALIGLRVLVVEDNPTNTLIAKHMLEQEKCNVMTASDGQQALDMLQKFDYDAIFMDVAMPVMDGLTACRKIRAIGGGKTKLPIIAMTAHASKNDIAAAKEAGMSDYLTKPVNKDLMMGTLRRLTSKPKVITPINR